MVDGANHVLFTNRIEAGMLLSSRLSPYVEPGIIVLGLARGGVEVASAVSRELALPLDVLVVKKIPSMYNAEFALGAVAPDGVSVIHWPEAHSVGADEKYINDIRERLVHVIKEKASLYRKTRKPLDVSGHSVMLVDDGAATGSTMEAAIAWARKRYACKIIVALPVASKDAVQLLKPEADVCVVYQVEDDLSSVGQCYEAFPQVSDEEVIRLVGAQL